MTLIAFKSVRPHTFCLTYPNTFLSCVFIVSPEAHCLPLLVKPRRPWRVFKTLWNRETFPPLKKAGNAEVETFSWQLRSLSNFFSFWRHWELEPGPHACCKLVLSLLLISILRQSLVKLPGMALNLWLSGFSLLSSWQYRPVPPVKLMSHLYSFIMNMCWNSDS